MCSKTRMPYQLNTTITSYRSRWDSLRTFIRLRDVIMLLYASWSHLRIQHYWIIANNNNNIFTPHSVDTLMLIWAGELLGCCEEHYPRQNLSCIKLMLHAWVITSIAFTESLMLHARVIMSIVFTESLMLHARVMTSIAYSVSKLNLYD